MAELHKEINECDISHKEELHAFLSSKLKVLHHISYRNVNVKLV